MRTLNLGYNKELRKMRSYQERDIAERKKIRKSWAELEERERVLLLGQKDLGK